MYNFGHGLKEGTLAAKRPPLTTPPEPAMGASLLRFSHCWCNLVIRLPDGAR